MTATRPVSAEELWRLPGDQRRELVQGEVRTMPPSCPEHGDILIRLGGLLSAHATCFGLGKVYGGETGFILARNPDTVRGVDIAFVRSGRAPAGKSARRYFNGAPDLAVEILSPADRLGVAREKVEEYLGAGCSLVWLVNPRRRTVTIYRPNVTPAVLRPGETIDGAEVLPGFSCPVSELFI